MRLDYSVQRNHPPLMARYMHESDEIAAALKAALSEWKCFSLNLLKGPDPADPEWAALHVSTCELDHETMDRVVGELIEKAGLTDRLVPWEEWRQLPVAMPSGAVLVHHQPA